jgi:hypothetical protein
VEVPRIARTLFVKSTGSFVTTTLNSAFPKALIFSIDEHGDEGQPTREKFGAKVDVPVGMAVEATPSAIAVRKTGMARGCMNGIGE